MPDAFISSRRRKCLADIALLGAAIQDRVVHDLVRQEVAVSPHLLRRDDTVQTEARPVGAGEDSLRMAALPLLREFVESLFRLLVSGVTERCTMLFHIRVVQ